MFRYTIKILLINLISLGLGSQIVNASNLENGKSLRDITLLLVATTMNIVLDFQQCADVI